MSNLERAAVYYAKKFGFHVFPVGQDKKPITSHGHKDATNDPAAIAKVWTENPRANIGIAVKPSKLVVLDLDTKSSEGINAFETLAELEKEFGNIPETPHTLTPGGGIHFYFKTDSPLPRACGVRPGVDIIGDGYAIAPPSIGANMASYDWDAMHRLGEIPLAPVPEWIIEIAKTKSNGQETSRHTSDFWDELLRDGIPLGKRNASLLKIAGHLYRKGADVALTCYILDSLNKTRCHLPLESREVTQILESAAAMEKKRRKARGF